MEHITMTNDELEKLARTALACLLGQKYVTVSFQDKSPYRYFPLPVKKSKPDESGMVTQEYRPIAILEYVNDVLSGKVKAKQVKKRRASAQDDTTDRTSDDQA